MDMNLCRTIKTLRLHKNMTQLALADALGISVQAVSKWENEKAMPDILLLPEIARVFDTSIDALFQSSMTETDMLPADVHQNLSINHSAWDGISSGSWRGSALPNWGVYIPNEEKLHLLDELEGKKVLEIACGAGRSLVYCGKRKAKELWGLDISENQLQKASALLKENRFSANLFHSPMELNPGIPERYFDCVYSVYGLGWTQDLDQTISLVSKYLKTNGIFVFSWDHPLLPCIEAKDGQYVISRSYVAEEKLQKIQRGEQVVLTNWKLSSYINGLAKHRLKVEQLVEDSDGYAANASFDGDYYSEHKAQYLHHTFVIKARKL